MCMVEQDKDTDICSEAIVAIAANLANINNLPGSEARLVLLLLSAMEEFSAALSDAKLSSDQTVFTDKFRELAVVKSNQLVVILQEFFTKLASDEKIRDTPVLDAIASYQRRSQSTGLICSAVIPQHNVL